jgi:hypothetical protein
MILDSPDHVDSENIKLKIGCRTFLSLKISIFLPKRELLRQKMIFDLDLRSKIVLYKNLILIGSNILDLKSLLK